MIIVKNTCFYFYITFIYKFLLHRYIILVTFVLFVIYYNRIKRKVKNLHLFYHLIIIKNIQFIIVIVKKNNSYLYNIYKKFFISIKNMNIFQIF